MKQQTALYWLVPLLALLAVITASVGLFSPGGLISKIAQILLEVALIYVIAFNWKKAKYETQ